jgi:hypothetical protein
MERLLKKIKTSNITLTLTQDKATFSYELDNEKLLNIARGKLHRGSATSYTEESDGGWKLDGTKLSVTYNLKTPEHPKKITFGDIQSLFEEMVK